MDYVKYTTQANDRFDLLAYKAYGDVQNAVDIVEANPGLAIEDVLPEGIDIRVPVLDGAVTISGQLLPPWLNPDNF